MNKYARQVREHLTGCASTIGLSNPGGARVSESTCRFCFESLKGRARIYCSSQCQKKLHYRGLRVDGSVVPGLHDTERCAAESGCERVATASDLCFKHYQRAAYNDSLPPSFLRWVMGQHWLTDVDRTAGTANCTVCGPNAAIYMTRHSTHVACSVAHWAAGLKQKYGLSIEQYDNLLISQANRCAICQMEPRGRTKTGRLSVDHCHRSGAIRALLCDWCNNALGLLEDSAERFERAAEYLSREWPPAA